MIIKRILGTIGWLLLSLLVACGPGRDEPPPAVVEEAGPAEVAPAEAVEAAAEAEPPPEPEVGIFYASYFETRSSRNPEGAIIDQFEATHPDIAIFRRTLDFSPDTILAYLREIPFMTVITVWADYGTLAAMAEGAFLDLEQLRTDTPLVETYPAVFLELGRRDGKQFFLPAFSSWFGIYYNRAVFERLNLQPPQTWGDFLAICETLQANGITPLVYNGGQAALTSVWFDYLDMRLNGPEFHADLLAGRERYDDPRVRDVFKTWAFLVESDFIVANAWGLNLTESRDMVVNERAGMILLNSGDAIEGLDFFPFPAIEDGLPVGEVVTTLGYVIPAQVEYPTEALEFLTYLISIEAQSAMTQQFAREASFLPLHQGVDPAVFSAKMAQGVDLVRRADHVRPPYYLIHDGALVNPLGSAFRHILLKQDYEEDLTRLERAYQQLFGE